MNFSFFVLTVSSRPFCCSKMKWNGLATNINASQSYGFSEEKRSPDAWIGYELVGLFHTKCVIARKSGKSAVI
jgi:hypothetical protein